jgi:hypothetical protein
MAKMENEMIRTTFGALAIGALALTFVAVPAALPSLDGAAWANGSHGGSSGPGASGPGVGDGNGGGGGGGNPGSSGPGASGPGKGDGNGN